jgi:hypothetical protein
MKTTQILAFALIAGLTSIDAAASDREMNNNFQSVKNHKDVFALGVEGGGAALGKGAGVSIDMRAYAGAAVMECGGGKCNDNTQMVENHGKVTALGAATAGSAIMNNKQ